MHCTENYLKRCYPMWFLIHSFIVHTYQNHVLRHVIYKICWSQVKKGDLRSFSSNIVLSVQYNFWNWGTNENGSRSLVRWRDLQICTLQDIRSCGVKSCDTKRDCGKSGYKLYFGSTLWPSRRLSTIPWSSNGIYYLFRLSNEFFQYR